MVQCDGRPGPDQSMTICQVHCTVCYSYLRGQIIVQGLPMLSSDQQQQLNTNPPSLILLTRLMYFVSTRPNNRSDGNAALDHSEHVLFNQLQYAFYLLKGTLSRQLYVISTQTVHIVNSS